MASDADVDDIGAEWVDRYGPLPAAALGLLALARLRTAAMRRGVREITQSSVRPVGSRQPMARITPVRLAASAQVRLRRLAPGATYKEELAQLLVPLGTGELAADRLRQLLEDLIPPADSESVGDTL